MLRFIKKVDAIAEACENFNTSHVTVYRGVAADFYLLMDIFQYISCYGLSYNLGKEVHDYGISIHLMLRFICFVNSSELMTPLFQYISCYGLSQKQPTSIPVANSFQYISCYGLSITSVVYLFISAEFQYISCYGLSNTRNQYPAHSLEFQYISCYGLSCNQQTDNTTGQ